MWEVYILSQSRLPRLSYKSREMLIGEYIHTIDSKKRLALPAKFRREVGTKLIVSTGFERSLYVHTPGSWEKMTEELSGTSLGTADERSLNRFFLASAFETDVDAIGRILIPDYLKDFAGLTEKVAVIGLRSRIELWDEEEWQKYKARVAKDADKLAEKLGNI
ncbi:MAG: division/cell wall cluster transcriptional repressor MraZ [Candidatus Vogelbacteria bacterium CG10_big_fil_rev_8_21_14_0_10_45_14]|uniref:Transcriptional regulator MraZ n=1 Tax=Candidatus Vogelbacteria bacterium CG10_big_fil_rev_8_21_14_0_10_45_14 TaxID=1975042 RepID=A0A2H0RJR2_9BACT|nr:MAG: division/cell wall cluster transcriptional repressor MraZ [Candidatus Vogelbacteria bacterium CG10_big_fil_rev_8_21_14_0_10_45_14]